MTTAADPTPAPAKRSKLPLIVGLVLAIAGGGGGFLAVQMGLLSTSADGEPAEEASLLPPMAPVAYLALDPLIVTLPRSSGRQYLRFVVQLEVAPEHLADVEAIKPRIIDVMNGYLRAVAPADFEGQGVLEPLRAQLLRRIQVVSGEGRVRDLLVMEFLLN